MSWYQQERYLFVTLDPVHVGAGGNRLGRVDMTIVREPGTNVPKVPGTSLAGAARSYAAMTYGRPEAAGQQKKLKTADERNAEKCPILYTFGTASDTDPLGSKAGVVSISDARILFFPVYSMSGPVWTTTPELLTEGGFKWSGAGVKDDEKPAATTLSVAKGRLNVGWLLLETDGTLSTVSAPERVSGLDLWKEIAPRMVLLTSKYFSQIVNNHLEVRTSVSINPETGAAEEHALFTYEAIPRGTWLMADVVIDDYKKKFPPTAKRYGVPAEDLPGEEKWETPVDVVHSGLSRIEELGVGGMGTRGFGRMKVVARW